MDILTNNTPEKWEQIKTHPFYEEARRELLAYGEICLTTPVPYLCYSDYCRYYRDGDRVTFQKPYGERAERLRALTVLCRMYGEKYLPALCDVIWAITEEHTWAMPAHIKDDFEREDARREFLELGSTERGAMLAECDHILGDMLPAVVRQEIRRTVRERVILSYFKNLYWWFDGQNNWGPVCSFNVALCIAYLGTLEEFFRAEPTFHRTMEQFLLSYGKDGCCLEGINYWNYGFGYFLRYAELVKNYTTLHPFVQVAHAQLSVKPRQAKCIDGEDNFVREGVVNYYLREDVKRAAMFPLYMHLTGDYSVSFSDGSAVYRYSTAYFHLLKREYPDAVFYPERRLAISAVKDVRFWLWSDPEAAYGHAFPNQTVYYPDGQWYICKKEGYSLAAKGGYNHEPHNHNDIGSFLITTEEDNPLCDLGSPLYDRDYFEPLTRYGYLVASSRGHSLPIINGEYQKQGFTKATVTERNDCCFALEYGFAYEISTLKSAVRRFDCQEDEVMLTDTFAFDETPFSLVERFVSLTEPVLSDGTVTLGKARLRYDERRFDASFTTEDFTDSGERKKTVYLVDLTVKNPQKEEAFVFHIQIR